MWPHGFAISSNVENIFRVNFRSFLLPDNGSKNSMLNSVLKLQRFKTKSFNPNTPYFNKTLIKHCLIKLFDKTLNSSYCEHVFCFVIEIFVLFKYLDHTKNSNLVGNERNGMEIDAPRPPSAFSFKLNLVLKTVAAFSAGINPDLSVLALFISVVVYLKY